MDHIRTYLSGVYPDGITTLSSGMATESAKSIGRSASPALVTASNVIESD